MTDIPKRVLIVNVGEWGIVKRESYDSQAEMFERRLTRAGATVNVVTSMEDARKRFPMSDVAVFLTRGMTETAKEIAGEFRSLRVVVLTGLIPRDEVVFISKGWIAAGVELGDLILHL
ncbi:MAG: hypothetical protein ABH880_03130 [Patescibacteria group bacterium]